MPATLRSPLGRPAACFAFAIAAIGAFWWWMGAPVPMPPSPLAKGEKLYCISYAPFRGAQSPLDLSTRVERWQIEDDLANLARESECVRTYSISNGIDQVPEIARRFGLKMMLGLWLGREAARNNREIESAVALARQYPDVVRSIVVGNEVLLRGEMSGPDLANIIRGVKARVNVPVTYADVWEFWLRHREVYDAVDFVTIHILPYWEDFPIAAANAADHVASIRRQMAQAFPNKEILIGETGWPSQGRMREGALPSPANQTRVIHEVLAAGKRDGFRVNVIEAFDQPWKRALEGTVGGHWGLFDAQTRAFKFAWGETLSNHPMWILQALAGFALAVLVIAAAFFCSDRKQSRDHAWFGVTANAVCAGAFIGLAIEKVPLESLGAGGWLRSLVFMSVAITAPVLGSIALMRRETVPAFYRVLRWSERELKSPFSAALGFTFIVLTLLGLQVALGLAFDPRYRDFPFAPMTAALVPFGVLAFASSRPIGGRGTAETAAAGTLALCAIYIGFNEGPLNWQSLWFCGDCAALALILWRARDAQS